MTSVEGQFLGKYELIEVLGKGGSATVYRARQVAIERLVAVKILSPLVSADERFKLRFDREAKTIARLEHDRIVPIYDFGEEQGYFFLVMRMLDGSLNRLIRHGPLSLELTNHFVQQICSALYYAHDKNIIHRDMKPSNILLDRDNNAFLTDFGLAKIVGGTAITHETTLLGTPPYMAPEVWHAEEATPQTDLYALGVTLFEMLTGKLPFQADTPARLMYLHLENEPPSLVGTRPSISEGVQEVVHKLLAKNPKERYRSAAAVARDFERATQDVRHLRNGPQATPSLKKSRVVSGPRNSTAQQVVEQASDDLSDDATNILPARSDPSRKARLLVAASLPVIIGLAFALLNATRLNNSRAGGVQYEAPAPEARFRDEEEVRVPTTRELAPGGAALERIAWSADGQYIAGASVNGDIVVWDAEDGKIVQRWQAHAGGVSALAWNPNDNHVLVSGGGTFLYVWKFDGNVELVQTLSGHIETITTVAWSPNGSQVVSGDQMGRVLRWAVSNNWKQAGMQLTGPLRALDWSGDGTRYVSGGGDAGVRVWNAPTGASSLLGTQQSPIRALDWGAASEQIAVLSDDGDVRLWRADSAAYSRLARGLVNPVDVRFSPDEARVAAAHESEVTVWDTTTAQRVAVLYIGDTQNIRSIDWSPDGAQIAAATDAGLVRLWSAPSEVPARFVAGEPLAAHSGRVNRAVWDASGDRVATIGSDRALYVWSFATHERLFGQNAVHDADVTSVAWGPGPNEMATGGCDGSIALIDIASEHVLRRLSGHQGCVSGLAFSPDGEQLWSVDTAGRLLVWNLTTYEIVMNRERLHPGAISALIATEGPRFATLGEEGSLQIWEYGAESLQPVITPRATNTLMTAGDWNSTSKTLVTGDAAGRIWVWPATFDLGTNNEFSQAQASIRAIDSTFNGKYLADVDENGCLTLWAVATAETLFLECNPSVHAYRTLEWSPREDVLVAGSEQGEVLFWRVP